MISEERAEEILDAFGEALFVVVTMCFLCFAGVGLNNTVTECKILGTEFPAHCAWANFWEEGCG